MGLLIPLLVALFWLSGCSGVSVAVDYDRSQDFDTLNTYAWLAPEVETAETARILNSPLFARRVRQAVNLVLEGRQLAQVEPEQAELLVRFHLGLEQRLDVNTYGGNFFSFRDCWRCPGFIGGTEVVVNDYQQSVLAIDLLRADDRELIWRGVAERKARTFEDPAEYDRYIEETVNAILSRLPPALGRPAAEP